ncbi:DoxX family membrane protein, partial [Salmonella enterica subsp. diarizonae]|nr:DoxX family membrane protein [Salmonella enterica subsp. diarizonae]
MTDKKCPCDFSAKQALAILRILTCYPWLSGAFYGKDAKVSMDFIFGSGLIDRINEGFIHTALNPAIVNFLTKVVVPHASIFAFMLALGEVAAGLSFLFGLFTRLGGVIAILHSVVNLLVLWNAGPETFGQNYLLIITALTFVL